MSSPMYETPEHFPMEVTADGRGPATGDDVDHVDCWCARGTSWPCADAIADVIRSQPGITSDELEATFRRREDGEHLDRLSLLETAHQSIKGQRIGQLLDGSWWSADQNDVIAELLAVDQPGPGTELFRVYRGQSHGLPKGPSEYDEWRDPRKIKEWGLRHG